MSVSRSVNLLLGSSFDCRHCQHVVYGRRLVGICLVTCIGLIFTVFILFWIPSLISLGFKYNGTTVSLSKDSWMIRLAANLCGYATVFVPGYIILRYIRSTSYIEPSEPGRLTNIIKLCFLGQEQEKAVRLEDGLSDNVRNGPTEKSIAQEARLLCVCVFGLLTTYLTWGILQEKIMTKEYITNNGVNKKFSDSQFLVFVNRVLAFFLSGSYILMTRQPRHVSPLYKYSFCSFSNIMSSWCQYEALKFVSFPTQVLAKASKIIPVMVMGKIVSRKTYDYYEYATAFVMSGGMAMFLLGSTEEHNRNTVTTFSGIVILAGYMAFDSFTSNWQSELFTQYKMSSVQMMCGVNMFSCLFTAASLIQQGAFVDSFSFMLTYPTFLGDIIILSLCSALGQLFIFYTISQFGAVVFVIIMTIRQGLAILLSCFIYDHIITLIGWLGILVVFLAIFVRMYCSRRFKSARRQKAYSNSDRSKV